MQKKIRSLFWLFKGIFDRHGKIIVTSFFFALILIIFGKQLNPGLWKAISNDRLILGLVGSYSPSDLPLSIQQLISIGLTQVDETGDVSASIAKSWALSEDRKRYSFYLRDDLYWHDGKKFTASDINYNLRDVEFVPVSDTELVVKLKDAFAPLPNFLSKPLFRKGLVGMGPYSISSIRLKGEVVSYLKLKSTKGLPFIEIKFYPTETQAKLAFQLGEVNVLEEIGDPTPLQEWKGLKIKETPKFDRFLGIFLNMNDEFLKQKEFRQALALALEKPSKNRLLSPISIKSWAYNTEVKPYAKDAIQAKKLVGDVESTSSATLTLSTFAPYLTLAQNIASAWEAIGVPTKIKVETGVPESYQALLVTQEIPPDPDQYTLWHSTQESTNVSHYTSAKIDKLLEDGRRETDKEERRKIYSDFQLYLVDDAPAIFLFHPTTYTISRK